MVEDNNPSDGDRTNRVEKAPMRPSIGVTRLSLNVVVLASLTDQERAV